MNDIITFTYENANIRVTTTEDGTPLFCGKDVAITLGYKDTTNALKLHCKGVVFYHPLETPGGTQQVRFITEPDLYRLITHSKLPEAEKFVLKDVRDALGLGNNREVARRLDEDCVSTTDVIDNLGRHTALKRHCKGVVKHYPMCK